MAPHELWILRAPVRENIVKCPLAEYQEYDIATPDRKPQHERARLGHPKGDVQNRRQRFRISALFDAALDERNDLASQRRRVKPFHLSRQCRMDIVQGLIKHFADQL